MIAHIVIYEAHFIQRPKLSKDMQFVADIYMAKCEIHVSNEIFITVADIKYIKISVVTLSPNNMS